MFDIVDLDYEQKDLWDYHIQTLKILVDCGVDGFGCDVSPLIPLDFWKQAREDITGVKDDFNGLAESIHPEFIRKGSNTVGCVGRYE